MTMSTVLPPKLTDVERIKSQSRHLRGTLRESLANPLTGALAEDDTQLIKFHGSYQQDDRDVREERRLQRLEPDYQFMIRTRLPGGVCTPAQWLHLDSLAARYANGTIRVTTRQAFQLHGIVKPQLKDTLAALNAALVDTFAACGDVNRNVLCSANPVDPALHAEVYRWCVSLSEHLLPKTRAYSELWIDSEQVSAPEENEPVYGDTYLPRKFKIAVAVPPLNDVDVFAHDLGFIAVVNQGVLSGFNVTVGGGMGATHGDAQTFPKLGEPIGWVSPDKMLAVAEQVVGIQRDFGDRTNRKHARLKYTIADRGLDWFRNLLEARLGFSLLPAAPVTFEHNGDRLGWVEGHDGRWHFTVHVESGRISDTSASKTLTAFRDIAKIHTGDFRLTPNQNVTIAGVEAANRAAIEQLLVKHRILKKQPDSGMRQNALACVALPTCALAMAEAERALGALLTRFERCLAANALTNQRIHFRITGCPNGCARPYLAEIALVGKGPGRYNLMLGGDVKGERLNVLYRENLDEDAIFSTVEPLLQRYSKDRVENEGFGDYLWRAGALSKVGQKATEAILK